MITYHRIIKDNYIYFEELLPMLYRSRFALEPNIQGLGASVEGNACGIVLYREEEELGILRLLYIAVSEPYQKQGIATDLLLTLSETTYNSTGLLAVTDFFAYNEDSPVYRLFDSSGMFSIQEETGHRAILSKRIMVDFFKKNKATIQRIPVIKSTNLGAMTNAQKNALQDFYLKNGPTGSSFDIELDNDLTNAVFSDQNIEMAVFVTKSLSPPGYYIPFLYSSAGEGKNVISIICRTLVMIFQKMKEPDSLIFESMTDSVDTLFLRFFGEDNISEHRYMAGYNGPYAI